MTSHNAETQQATGTRLIEMGSFINGSFRGQLIWAPM